VLEDYLADFRGCVIIVSHDRYFMDKVVDHLLVFKGNAEIDDFPGNYTQYREWQKLQSKSESDSSSAKSVSNSDTTSASKSGPRDPNAAPAKRKLSYKERQEFDKLEKEIEKLSAEKADIENALSSGTIDVEKITELSKRLPILNEELDEKEMRWLELSEFA
jgi:ATP-binding cassette subfamily F protein uup